ncbi:MORN repeat variant family protein [Formosa agariphila KMM 3901]|uniref:MORN repeat variant family protein n=1 Tax=Formosa agariphila (strain DSM 15362 / KCTC 12365 / LMG 23005 / KMM 3901 / M-2Alg 35-1) TaxID=1347342 RepID=T2KJD5_FORAG|nr:protein translocase component YidC [Formosa agariphila]CDF78536.1 MORN repeat variant family protein [Formosa agariphila KMM 3901]
MKNVFAFLLMCVVSTVMAQSVNQFDANGKRDGVWKKNFDKTKVLRYEGQFSHGKEVGTFKFYKKVGNKAVLSAVKEFNADNDIAKVQFLTSSGKVISKGKMNGKLYIGDWVYYHKNSDKIMITEFYNENGKLEGERLVYYDNGKLAERAFYKNGLLNGTSTWYSEEEIVLKEFNYVNDKLQGMSKYYDLEGKLLAEGAFKNDKKDGIWNFYKNGELDDTKDFTNYSNNPYKQ